MKKTFYILALAAIVLSCAKEMETSNPAVSGEKVTVKVALAEDDATKVSLTEANDKKSMSLAWESSDAISINGENFTIKAGFSAHEAEFEGTAPASSPYTIIYPGKYADIDAFNARSYASQTQSGNSSTTHLEYNAALVGVSEYEEPKFDPAWAADKSGSLMQNGVLQLRLQLPSTVTSVTSVILKASSDIFPTTNEGSTKTDRMTLALTGATLPSNHILEAYMMFSAAGVTIADGEQLTVAVETPDKAYVRTVPLQAQNWAGGSQYTIQLKVDTENVFHIANATDLVTFQEGVNSGDFIWQKATVILDDDIDCSSISSWTPIGNGTFEPVESGSVSATWSGPAFQGTFDGKDHAIKNLNMTGSPATYKPFGLFGILYKATVKNLTLGAASGDNGALSATPQERMDAGAVAGVAYGATVQDVTNYFPMTIPDNNSPNRVAMGMVGYVYGDAASGPSVLSGLNNYGKVTAQSPSNTGNGATSIQVAGIAGFGNSGASSVTNQISACTNYAYIDADCGRSAGILASANARTAINGCVNNGKVTNTFTNSRVGGITVILGASSTLTDCTNNAAIEAIKTGSNVGGLVCLVNHTACSVTNSSNTGSINGTNYVGGISSRIYSGTITLCVNTGAISGSQYIGGILGGMGNNNGWPYVNKCRSDATITSSSSVASCAGGLVGQMLGGVLNTCFAKGIVTAKGYDVGGAIGQMYCNNATDAATYGRQYVFDCMANVNVSTTRTSGSANIGGFVGRISRHASTTGQYIALDNCICLNNTVSAGSLPYAGAFVGQVTAGAATNFNYVRVRNCISLVEDSNYTATATANVGGFVGGMPYGYMSNDYYLISTNTQTFGGSGKTTTTNVEQSTLANIRSSEFIAAHSDRAAALFLNVADTKYVPSAWVIPTGCLYPVPKTLADLGSNYYE